MSTREAKNGLSALIAWARENRDEVIVESDGEPAAVVMAYDEYERVRQERQRRRREAIERLREIQRQVSERNRDLTPEQVEEIAERVSRDVMDGLIASGKVCFRE